MPQRPEHRAKNRAPGKIKSPGAQAQRSWAQGHMGQGSQDIQDVKDIEDIQNMILAKRARAQTGARPNGPGTKHNPPCRRPIPKCWQLSKTCIPESHSRYPKTNATTTHKHPLPQASKQAPTGMCPQCCEKATLSSPRKCKHHSLVINNQTVQGV